MAITDRYETGNALRPASEISSRSRSRILFGLTVAVFTLVVLRLGITLNLYIDELYSLHTTSRGFGYALEQSLGFEQQPPLFFLALTAWRTLSMSDAFARLFPLVCGVLTLFVVYSFARRRLGTLPDWVVPLAIALNPFFFWAALDVRVYALIILLSAVLVTTFFDAFVDEDASPVKAVFFTLAAIAALYTQYFIGGLFVGFAATLALHGPRRNIVPFLLSMAVVVLACLPLFPQIVNEFQQATVVNAIPPPALARRMLAAAVSFVYPHAWIAPVSAYLNVAYVAVVLISLAILARKLRFDLTLQRFLTIVACVVAFFLLVILGAQVPLETPRHISTLFVPLVLLAFACVAALRERATRVRALVAFMTVLALCSAANAALSFRPPLSKVGDWHRVGDFLSAHVKPGEPIAVFDAEDVLGVTHYFHGRNPIVALPRAQSFAVFDRRDFAIRDSAQLAAVFPAPSPVTHRAWLVFGVAVCPIVELGNSCALLDAYVYAHFHVAQQREFDGTVVRELRVR